MVAGILVIFPVFSLAKEDLTANKYKQIQAVRAEIAPVIDGVLDDPAWKQASVIKDLHQARPHEYTKPNNRSEFYVIYDKDAVYIGAHLWDSEPDKITANILNKVRRCEMMIGLRLSSILSTTSVVVTGFH